MDFLKLALPTRAAAPAQLEVKLPERKLAPVDSRTRRARICRSSSPSTWPTAPPPPSAWT
jgi:hypothetical protein